MSEIRPKVLLPRATRPQTRRGTGTGSGPGTRVPGPDGVFRHGEPRPPQWNWEVAETRLSAEALGRSSETVRASDESPPT